MLLLGEDDQFTLMNNYFHDVSGRAPKLGSEGTLVVHAVNNLFSNNQGHDFDVTAGASVLIEGNVFSAVDTPIFPDATGNVFNVPEGSESQCVGYLGRDCIANTVTDSGEWVVYDSIDALSALGNGTIIEPMEVIEVEEYVLGNAGIGLL
jgi:pectin lyase